MSRSPLMSPGHSRLRRERARRKRGRRRIAMGAIALAALAAIALALVLAKPAGHGSASASARASARPSSPAPPAVPRSAIGLPLGQPALALRGLGEPQRDSVHLAFHSPPRAGLLFNLQTGQVLWQRNPERRMRIASLTKMMTALLAVQSAAPRTPVLITKQAVETAGSKVGVLPLGRHVRLETMLYGLMLPSGNDAAYALAHQLAGSAGAFVKRMNEEAAALGMGCTRYSSPSGYFDEGNFSCAADLALLAHVDMEQPRLARVAHTLSAELPFPIKGGHLFLYNNNPLLIYHYPGATGLKTGYTLAAGRCLVGTAERHGVKLGVVLLHSTSPGEQARALLDRAFAGVYRLPAVREQPLPTGA